MNWVRRDGFVTALREGILWYCTAQQEHSPEAAELLAQRFADAVDHTLDKIVRRPTSGVVWPHRQGYRFALVKKPFDRWLIFYRQPDPMTIEFVDITRVNATCQNECDSSGPVSQGLQQDCSSGDPKAANRNDAGHQGAIFDSGSPGGGRCLP